MFLKTAVILGCLVAISWAYKADLSTDGDCSKNKTLTVSLIEGADIVTDGSISNHYCSVKFEPSTNLRTSCSSYYPLCLQVTQYAALMGQCYGKVRFTATIRSDIQGTDAGKKVSWEYGCVPLKNQNELPPEICHDVSSLKVEVVESKDKTYKQYNFQAKLVAKCSNKLSTNSSRDSPYVTHHDDAEFHDIMDAVHQNRVIGIVVAVCLASVFLIILVITYFYYKNKPYSSVPSK